jgi:hypothetical protein
MKELIGKKFKRNKYGLSDWTSIISEVGITRSTTFNPETRNAYWIPEIWIRSSNGVVYDFSEIVIVMENVDWEKVDKLKNILNLKQIRHNEFIKTHNKKNG